MHFVLIPLITRHTNSVISLSDTSHSVKIFSEWQFPLSHLLLPQNMLLRMNLSSQLSERAEVAGGECHVSPHLHLGSTCPYPAFLLPGYCVCLALLSPFFMCMYIFIYIYIRTHVAVPGSFHSTLMLQMHVLWK